MSYTLVRTLITAMGFCCPYAFFRAVRGRSHPMVANRLGISRETVKYWRRKVRQGRTICECTKHCAKARFDGEVPRIDLLSLREGVSDPFV